MAEGNSYTFAVIVILGLVALFFIYWYTTSGNSSNKTYQPQLRQEHYANDDGESDEGGEDEGDEGHETGHH